MRRFHVGIEASKNEKHRDGEEDVKQKLKPSVSEGEGGEEGQRMAVPDPKASKDWWFGRSKHGEMI